MKIKNLTIEKYEIPLVGRNPRQGAILTLENSDGECSYGDIAPLPERSRESLQQALIQFEESKNAITTIDWQLSTCLEAISRFTLYPSLAFAFESALLSLLKPIPECFLEVAALIMGPSPKEILKVAEDRKQEGFTTAKLKVGNLSLKDALTVISELKNVFKLRIDVNSAWKAKDTFDFFDKFSEDTFDFIEDPFSDLADLKKFNHPYAIEEPLAKGISLSQLESHPNLKAIIYKPTVLGGIQTGRFLQKWASKHNTTLVLSSAFESDIGHYHLAAIAHRIGIDLPLGIGTYHYLGKHLSKKPLQFFQGKLHLNSDLKL